MANENPTDSTTTNEVSAEVLDLLVQPEDDSTQFPSFDDASTLVDYGLNRKEPPAHPEPEAQAQLQQSANTPTTGKAPCPGCKKMIGASSIICTFCNVIPLELADWNGMKQRPPPPVDDPEGLYE